MYFHVELTNCVIPGMEVALPELRIAPPESLPDSTEQVGQPTWVSLHSIHVLAIGSFLPRLHLLPYGCLILLQLTTRYLQCMYTKTAKHLHAQEVTMQLVTVAVTFYRSKLKEIQTKNKRQNPPPKNQLNNKNSCIHNQCLWTCLFHLA